VNFYDAHNHLQDDRFAGRQGELLAACDAAGVRRMVVNGACEADWPQVLALARENKIVLPSFGYHPWYLGERTPDWQSSLEKFLDEVPSAVGEIGLDRCADFDQISRSRPSPAMRWDDSRSGRSVLAWICPVYTVTPRSVSLVR